MKYDVFGCTDRGWVRPDNQDHILIGRFVKNAGGMGLWFAEDDDYYQEYGFLLAVADGIGGRQGGRQASQIALRALEQHCASVPKSPTVEAFATALGEGTQRANAAVLETGQHPSGELTSLGTTLAGIYLGPLGYWVFNAGDSRVYRIRDRAAKRLTRDDTRLEDLLARGANPEGARRDPEGPLLTNWVGCTEFRCDLAPGPALRGGDVLLACSDGLHSLVGDRELGEIAGETATALETIARSLLKLALERGGDDNISLVLLRATELATTPSTEEVTHESA